MKKDQKFEKRLLELSNEMRDRLPIEDIKNIMELIDHGEYGLAYEILCTQIYEYNIKITLQYYEEISSLGKLIGFQSYIWLPLKELI